MLGDQALDKLLRDYEFETVLDIGSGAGEQAKVMREAGKRVTTLDSDPAVDADVLGDFSASGSLPTRFLTRLEFPDCIWCSHVLEHNHSPQVMLRRMRFMLGGTDILAVTVPPFRQVVAGHVTAWNAGLLLYNLVLAGFDCAEAAVKTYDYNISVIVRKSTPTRATATQPLTELAQFFPVPLTGERPQIGVLPTDIEEVNW